MPSIPTFHPRKWSHPYAMRLKELCLGSRHLTVSDLVPHFPEYLERGMEFSPIHRANLFSSSFSAERTYFIKVVNGRHLRAHRLFTRWRNLGCRLNGLESPFRSFETPAEMATHEYEAATALYEQDGAIARPYDISEIENGQAAILYEYLTTAGKIEGSNTSLSTFHHVLTSLHQLHSAGYIHGSLPEHVVRTTPSGEPQITDPTGAAADAPQAHLYAIGYDLASLLVRYAPHVGVFPTLNCILDEYDPVHLYAAHQVVDALQLSVPGTAPWVTRQIKSAISIETPDDIAAQFETYCTELSISSPTGSDDTGSGSEDDDKGGHTATNHTGLDSSESPAELTDDEIRLSQYRQK